MLSGRGAVPIKVQRVHTKADGSIDGAENTVFATIPYAGSRVCTGTRVWVYVVAKPTNPPGCSLGLPPLAGLTAETALIALRLKLPATWTICDVGAGGKGVAASECVAPPQARSIAAAVLADTLNCRIAALFEPEWPKVVPPVPPPEPKCAVAGCESPPHTVSILALVSGVGSAAIGGGLLATHLARTGQGGPTPVPQSAPFQAVASARLRVKRDIDTNS